MTSTDPYTIVWNVFGSGHESKGDDMWAVSTECDVMVCIDKAPVKIHMCHKICDGLKEPLGSIIMTDKVLNINLCTVATVDDKTHIDWVFKGTPDECNNSVFTTYGFHKDLQQHPCFINMTMDRNVTIKIVRSTRATIGLFSRSSLNDESIRSAVKAALTTKTHQLRERIKIMRTLDFEHITLPKKAVPVNVWKTVAFQIGQTMALLETDEVFSKYGVAQKYPSLTCYLRRDVDADLESLTEFKNKYLAKLDELVESKLLDLDTVEIL